MAVEERRISFDLVFQRGARPEVRLTGEIPDAWIDGLLQANLEVKFADSAQAEDDMTALVFADADEPGDSE